ncbi:16S rRNA (cytidine(1402)-2'-O)-methyltransferase [Glaciecola sp. 1036]|uniref:16S rRNA (cytidine(1402)-2'-O)-methyltransferase n=1 Tax=Alteromonadaceae TaxID=72275 RepID=UPI003CFE0ECA
MSAGTLYVVPTPIGNLGDMTPRAIEVLNEVDLVAAEDTRHSGKLFQAFDIKTQAFSLHDHNERQKTDYIIEQLKQGKNIALISDAGTPLISDPGFGLVRACRQQQLQVTALPGACALTTALSGAGLPTDRFTFSGFLPVKQQARLQALEQAVNSGMTCVFYESPKRILGTVEMIDSQFEDVQIVVAKELSKTFERYVGETPTEVLSWLTASASHQKGEFVVILYKAKTQLETLPPEALALMHKLADLLPPKKVAEIVAEHYQLNKKEIYSQLIASKDS